MQPVDIKSPPPPTTTTFPMPSTQPSTITSKMTSLDSYDAPTPALPAELWLQVLELHASDNLAHLWISVRPVSRTFKAYVERVFTHTHLPTLSLSLTLPRHDPITGALKYKAAIPGTELVFTCPSIEGERIMLSTYTKLHDNLLDDYKRNGTLPKERLDNATSVFLCFGQNRAKGGQVVVPIDARWDEETKLWKMDVEWKKLCSSYFEMKRRRAQATGPKMKGLSARNTPGSSRRTRRT
jgi:hypothetical protein